MKAPGLQRPLLNLNNTGYSLEIHRRLGKCMRNILICSAREGWKPVRPYWDFYN